MDCNFPQHHGKDGGGGGGIAGALIVILAAIVGVVITPLLHILGMIIEVGVPVVALGGAAMLVLVARHRVRHREVGTSPLAAVLSPARPRRQALPEGRGRGLYPPHITADDIADALIRRHQGR
jgi:hypothetical protein